ncbi:hypothetical protein SPLC1_S410930 [Arthrospira platensis C1]|nr:hypothetical protein SPLC1_S410930 [Arthrospira platensis C1]
MYGEQYQTTDYNQNSDRTFSRHHINNPIEIENINN